jgi:hypothetical protein
VGGVIYDESSIPFLRANLRHPRESGGPAPMLAANATVVTRSSGRSWVPAFAGMTVVGEGVVNG